MELKLMREGTEYILGLPISPRLFSQVINYEEGTIESYSSFEEAKRARDKVITKLNKPLLIYERSTRRLE